MSPTMMDRIGSEEISATLADICQPRRNTATGLQT
jgi:hypothetical protein